MADGGRQKKNQTKPPNQEGSMRKPTHLVEGRRTLRPRGQIGCRLRLRFDGGGLDKVALFRRASGRTPALSLDIGPERRGGGGQGVSSPTQRLPHLAAGKEEGPVTWCQGAGGSFQRGNCHFASRGRRLNAGRSFGMFAIGMTFCWTMRAPPRINVGPSESRRDDR